MPSLKALLTRRWMLIIGAAYVVLGMLARHTGYHQEDGAWFRVAAESIANGSFDLYTRLDQVWAAPPLGMAFTYPPLMPLMLAPLVVAGKALGLSAANLETLIALPWLICDVLLAGQIMRLTARWTGGQSLRWQVVAFTLPLLTFIVPISSAYMGHHESFILLLILCALQTRRPLAAGAFWGLALASKQTAAFALLPVALLLLREAWPYRRDALARLAAFFLPAAAIPLALILPFWLRWPQQAGYSLFGVEARRILYGINAPQLLNSAAERLAPALQPEINALLVRWASPLFLLLAGGFALLFALRVPRAALETESGAAGWRPPWHPPLAAPTIAAMGAIFAAFICLGKWSEMHYRFMPLMLLLTLDLLERPDFPYVYVLFALAAQSYAFADPLTSYWRLGVFAVMAVYFAARALVPLTRLAAQPTRHPPAPEREVTLAELKPGGP